MVLAYTIKFILHCEHTANLEILTFRNSTSSASDMPRLEHHSAEVESRTKSDLDAEICHKLWLQFVTYLCPCVFVYF